MFCLDQKLEGDTYFVADLKISRLLLMNDSNYPWFILVPRKEGFSEITDLTFEDQTELLSEINLVANFLQKNLSCDKTNIASLGNVVKQLHIHVIARFENDIAFPKPVWGFEGAKPYEEKAAQKLIAEIKSFLS